MLILELRQKFHPKKHGLQIGTVNTLSVLTTEQIRLQYSTNPPLIGKMFCYNSVDRAEHAKIQYSMSADR